MNNKNVVVNIGKRIATLRKQQGLNQDEFAEKAGKIRNTISKLERGVGDVQLFTLLDVVKALDVPIAELFAPDMIQKPTTNKIRLANDIIKILEASDEKMLKVIKKQIEALLVLK